MYASLYEIPVMHATGAEETLARYKGQTLLIVNVASQCGFTPQYQGLEALYQCYRDRGLHILAFPCNDFGGQEPGTMQDIQQFCSLHYNVTFDLFEKLHCIGDERHPLYTWLVEHSGNKDDVKWNFEKFLISKDGRVLQRFESKIAPEDPTLVQAVEQALA